VELAFLFVLSGAFLGWGLGSNDAANVFGTAVGTRVIKYRTAVILCAAALIVGALREGRIGIDKLGGFAEKSQITTPAGAFVVMLMAALTVTGMTLLKFPVSTSQCVIGSMIGWGFSQGVNNLARAKDFYLAWVITPVGAMVVCFVLCFVMERFLEGRIKGLVGYDMFIKIGYIAAGIFGAYSLGANNAANATGIYLNVGIFGEGTMGAVNGFLHSLHIPLTMTAPQLAALLGGLSIAVGVLTCSKPVMLTVGEGITHLSPLTGFLSVISCSILVYIFALFGIPVSTSQAVVGAVMGAGFAKGIHGVDGKALGRIFVAWLGTPTIAGVASFLVGTAFFK
jgi:PiT family inorganic phosphate transporter